MSQTTERNQATLFQISAFSGNHAATSSLSLIFTGFFLAYGSNVYSINTVLLGAIMMFTRVFDAFTDPLIGVWVDRTNTRLGRFRPWIILGALLMNTSFILIFWGIDFGSQLKNIIWITSLYMVWVIGYTFQTTITKAGQNVLSDVPKQRTWYSALSQMYTMLVLLTIYTLLEPFIEYFGGFSNPLAWRYLAFIAVGLQIVFTVLAVAGLWTKDSVEFYDKNKEDYKPKVRDYITMFKQNKALTMLIIAASTNKLANTMVQGLIIFFYFYVAKNVSLLAKVTPWMGVATALGIIYTTYLTNRFGRRKTFINVSKVAFMYGPLAVLLIMFSPSPLPYVVLVVMFTIFAFVTAGTELNITPMIGDTADYEFELSSQFVPGMIGSAFSLVDKFVSSFAGLFNGLILGLIGYVSFEETIPNDTLFWGILLAITMIPTLAHLASIIAITFYPIKDDNN